MVLTVPFICQQHVFIIDTWCSPLLDSQLLFFLCELHRSCCPGGSQLIAVRLPLQVCMRKRHEKGHLGRMMHESFSTQWHFFSYYFYIEKKLMLNLKRIKWTAPCDKNHSIVKMVQHTLRKKKKKSRKRLIISVTQTLVKLQGYLFTCFGANHSGQAFIKWILIQSFFFIKWMYTELSDAC